MAHKSSPYRKICTATFVFACELGLCLLFVRPFQLVFVPCSFVLACYPSKQAMLATGRAINATTTSMCAAALGRVGQGAMGDAGSGEAPSLPSAHPVASLVATPCTSRYTYTRVPASLAVLIGGGVGVGGVPWQGSESAARRAYRRDTVCTRVVLRAFVTAAVETVVVLEALEGCRGVSIT